METLAALKQMEGTLSITCDKLTGGKAKLEDFLFRAQRIASSAKNGLKSNDTMFGYDLQKFRRDIRTFSTEISSLPTLLGAIEREASYDEKAAKFATSCMRLAGRLSQTMRALHDMSLLAHSHIRAADHKIEAWYLAQEIEEMVMRGQGMPTVANRIVIATQTPVAGGAAPAPAEAPADPAAAPPAEPPQA